MRLSQASLGGAGNTQAGSRVFRYEVTGLRQNENTDKNDYSIRNSGSVYINVPYNRMNEVMQRITRMGGKIVNIEPLSNGAESGGSGE